MANCPQCGEEMGSGDPAGLCPKCLIQGAFDSSVGGDESRTQTIHTNAQATGDAKAFATIAPAGRDEKCGPLPMEWPST